MKTTMKTYKLCIHNKTSKNQEILLSPKDFPDVKAGDIVELYTPETDGNRIVLQVKQLCEDLTHKDSVSIEQSIANIFSFKSYKDVHVNKVDPRNVHLDLVELVIKEQYYGRSDMWRLMTTLTNTCVHLKKTLEYSEMRININELWARGENVTSGFITSDTKIVFRSPTAVFQIFIQMSAEMWDFDLYGDLYFEKAVNGFLTELFDRWKDQASLHDVTIVLFSRTFYDAQSLEDFPPSFRECLSKDAMGRIYEDFYRIVVQNERYEEWSCVLQQLRTLFSSYQQTVLHYHEHDQQGWKMPKAFNSLSSQGNVLETLNMSLNLFEKYYVDRNFDRTGKVSVVITPGPGVFEVDRQLANITKQRTIDCGIGSDLVCMGEKPLHAAPLFKFHSKSCPNSIEVGDDYSIPHWINHSFYMSKKIEDHKSSFVPQIEPPLALLKLLEEGPKPEKKRLLPHQDYPDTNLPFVDYDEHDNQVFKLPAGTIPRTMTISHRQRSAMPETILEAKMKGRARTRQISDNVLDYMNEYKEPVPRNMSPAITIPNNKVTQDDLSSSFGIYPKPEKAVTHNSVESSESDELISQRPVVGSAGSLVGHSRNIYDYRPHRALINPFAPSRLQFKTTSNRRRWVHAFPVDHQGRAIQARHVHSVPDSGENSDAFKTHKEKSKGVLGYIEALTSSKRTRPLMSQQGSVEGEGADIPASGSSDLLGESPVSKFEPNASGTPKKGRAEATGPYTRRMQHARTRMFGSVKFASDQVWSPDISTGYLGWRKTSEGAYTVDWKSLTYPAALPITTDFLPWSQLEKDYFVWEYSLIPETVSADNAASWSRMASFDEKTIQYYRRPPLTTKEAFMELLSQRIGLGFQLVTKKQRSQLSLDGYGGHNSSGAIMKSRMWDEEQEEEHILSIGRIYHKLSLKGQDVIVVKTYRPIHPQPVLCYEYRYRFQVPDAYSYDVSWTNFCNAKLEEYNWNHLDQYICTQGDSEQGLIESMKYWRSRFLLLPLNNPATKKIIDKEVKRCDIYEKKTPAELNQLIHGFLKFLEIMNKIKRPSTQRKSKADQNTPNTNTENGGQEEKLNITSPLLKIVEALVDPSQGMNPINTHPGLPLNTFIAAEAVTWCLNNVRGLDSVHEAIDFMQKLMDENLVHHSSGNPNHRFIYGFYLYYVPQRLFLKPGQSIEPSAIPTTHLNTPGANYNYLFQNEWCEVTFLPVNRSTSDPDVSDSDSLKGFEAKTQERKRSDSMLRPEVDDWKIQTGKNYDERGLPPTSILHKYVNVEVDPNKKSDRKEFSVSRYHAYYSPKCAFEFQIQWMVATGSILGDLVNTFARRATSCGFHLLPVPCDPFALPYTENSDPLRGPIFVPMDMQAFGTDIFKDCSDERRQDILFTIQDTILKRFGFLPVCVKIPESSPSESTRRLQETYNHQYVHCTAGMFVLIPESNPGKQPQLNLIVQTPSGVSSGLKKKSSADLHKFYIARQGRPEAVPNQVGFLWSWNYMSSRRWRSGHTGDEVFQDTVLADFRKFCSNDEGRLDSFWKEFCHDEGSPPLCDTQADEDDRPIFD